MEPGLVDIATLRARWETRAGILAWGRALAALSRGAPWRHAVAGLPGDPPLDAAQGDLRGIDLRGTDLRGLDLHGARFDHASLDAVQLDGATLVGANLSFARAVGVSARGARLDGVVAIQASLLGWDLTDAWIEHANFTGASLVRAVLLGARCARTSWACADLTSADFRGAHLYLCDFEGARRVRTRFDAERRVGDGGPLPRGGTRPVELLRPQPGTEEVERIEDWISRTRVPANTVANLLREENWRHHLLAATAALFCPADPWLDERLWERLGEHSWVAPQIAAALSERDPLFVERAAPFLDPLRDARRAGALARLCADRIGLSEAQRFAVDRIATLRHRREDDPAGGDVDARALSDLATGWKIAGEWVGLVRAAGNRRRR